MLARVQSVFFGRNPRTSLWFLSVAAVLFAVTFRLLSVPPTSVDPRLSNPRFVTLLVSIGAIVGATANAARNEGILISLAVGTAPPLALWLFVGQRAGLLVPDAALWIGGFALAYGVPIGFVGFAIGTEIAHRTDNPGPIATTNGGTTEDPVMEASEEDNQNGHSTVLDRRIVWPLALLGLIVGGGSVGYCALPGVACTLGTVI